MKKNQAGNGIGDGEVEGMRHFSNEVAVEQSWEMEKEAMWPSREGAFWAVGSAV